MAAITGNFRLGPGNGRAFGIKPHVGFLGALELKDEVGVGSKVDQSRVGAA